MLSIINIYIYTLIEMSGVNGIVGVGGGSSMDAAKLAAFMCGDTK